MELLLRKKWIFTILPDLCRTVFICTAGQAPLHGEEELSAGFKESGWEKVLPLKNWGQLSEYLQDYLQKSPKNIGLELTFFLLTITGNCYKYSRCKICGYLYNDQGDTHDQIRI